MDRSNIRDFLDSNRRQTKPVELNSTSSAIPGPSRSSGSGGTSFLSTSAAARTEHRQDNDSTYQNATLPSSFTYTNGFSSSLSSNVGPMRTMSSLRAHRSSLYARPHLSTLDRSSISSRYSNQTASKSLVLGTRKVTDDLGEPQLTATAQMIVKSLQSSSAPVVNKGRFAIGSVKSLRSEVSLRKRKEPSSGPPTLRSLLELSPQTNFAPPVKTPRLTSSFESKKNSSGDDSQRGERFSLTNISKRSNSEEFDFGEAWSFDRVIGGIKETGNDSSSSSSDDDSSELGNVAAPKANSREEKWECPACMVICLMSQRTCVCCGEINPNIKSSDSEKKPPGTSETKNQTFSDFKFGFPKPEEIKPPVTTEKDQPKPIVKLQQKETWECPSCMVFNEMSKETCPCCGEAKPIVKLQQSQNEKWECPCCMVYNKTSDRTCQCCGAANPNDKSTDNEKKEEESSENKASPFSGFKLGINQSEVSQSSAPPVIEPPKTSTGVSAGTEFKFGITQTTPATAKASEDRPFKFGANPNLSKDLSKSPEAAKSPKIIFGLTPEDEKKAQEATEIKVQPFPGFKFGVDKPKEVKSPVTIVVEPPKPPEKTWLCKTCKEENNPMSQQSCTACGGDKPNFDTSKPPENEEGEKLTFPPFLGFKNKNASAKSEVPASVPFTSNIQAPFSFTSNTVPPPVTPLPQQPVVSNSTSFGAERTSPGEKRKAPETFIDSPFEPKSKARSPEPALQTPSEVKSGGLFDFKKPSTVSTEDKPDGGLVFRNPNTMSLTPATTSTPFSTIPSTTATSNAFSGFAFSTQAAAQPTSSSTNLFATPQPSNTLSTFNTPSTPSSFGTLQQKPATQPFSFGTPALATPAAPTQGIFQFGAQHNSTPSSNVGNPSGFGSGTLFGPGTNTSGGLFASATNSQGGFKPASVPALVPAANMFGQPSNLPTPTPFGTTPSASFNPTPNLNFAAAAPINFGQPQPQQPALFNLGPTSTSTEPRKIKKAVRRMR